MIRFLVNFVLFGILFFLIWVYFPEAFEKLVNWAQQIYDWAAHLISSAFSGSGVEHAPPVKHD